MRVSRYRGSRDSWTLSWGGWRQCLCSHLGRRTEHHGIVGAIGGHPAGLADRVAGEQVGRSPAGLRDQEWLMRSERALLDVWTCLLLGEPVTVVEPQELGVASAGLCSERIIMQKIAPCNAV